MADPQNQLPATLSGNPRRAILVGASSGIGAALARRLARDGWQLALLARRADRLDALCAEINAAAGQPRARAYAHDVNETAAVPALLERILADLGGLELFIYSAGIALPPGLKKYDFEKDRRTLAVNLVGALAWLNPVAALFQAQRAGAIVGISSVAGERGRVGNPSYNASKAALNSQLESLRNRLGRYGVHVLTVKPGWVNTEMIVGAKMVFGVISAERVADATARALRWRRQEIYVPGYWRLLAGIIRAVPSFIFRRLIF